MQPIQVPFLSPEYFTLIDAHPELASAFALGQEVIALSGGIAYQVVPSGTPVQTPILPTAVVTGPALPTPIAAQRLTITPLPGSGATTLPIPTVTSSAPAANSPCLAGILPCALLFFLWMIFRVRRN
jgi:hypothetical protein